MKSDWLNLEGRDGEFVTAVDRLNASPYDELVEIDLINDRCRNICHIDGKFFVPVMGGGWSELLRYSQEHMVHPQDRELYAALMDPDTLAERLALSDIPGVLSEELRFRTVEGAWLWTRQVLVGGRQQGLPDGIVYCYIYDIDLQKQREQGNVSSGEAASATIRRDDLTGLLLDRDFFALAQRKLHSLTGKWCVVAVDIENFKLFCDWHGQQVGRFLLAEIGEILQRVERDTGGLAGYRGQDDFSLLIPYDIQRINALYEELQKRIEARGDSVGFMPLFGICMIESAEEEIMDVYNHAALSAEQLKGDFRNRIRVYDPDALKKNTEEYQILTDFQRGMEKHEVFFCLQPQCNVDTGKIVGAESLARWRTARGRMIPPARFIPILEKYGIVTNLDKYIWEGVCAWLRKWLDGGHTPVPVSVNVSRIDFFTIDVPAHFNMLLEKYRLPRELVKIEVTESAYVEDTAVVRETVRRLREQGFLVLMDDFGSGYSSLNMLRSLNVDVIKLDAQFLRISQSESRKGITILESILNMTRTMTLPVIAEGVETREQSNFLAGLGCRYMQGYYFYRPMPVEEFESLIRDGGNLDLNGFTSRTVDQFRTREFLDENVVSDVMLNNILGPVAFYRRSGDSVDIIRYNHQFLQMAGLDAAGIEARRTDILQFFHPGDRETFLRAMDQATEDRLNGARCMCRAYKPSGAICWLSVQLYFMEENGQGVCFYGGVEDVTELQYINREIPGGYHRCSADGGFEFYFVSDGFQEMCGFTAREIRERFDNKLLNMVHPADLEILRARAEAIRQGRTPENRPYRLLCKSGRYIYIVNQSSVTEVEGQVCFQSVAIDVTEVMQLRNQMRLLSRFLSDDVAFVLREGEKAWKYRVVVHGLEEKLGMTSEAFEDLLNSGALYRSLSPEVAGRLASVTYQTLEKKDPIEFAFTLHTPAGRAVPLHMKVDFVCDAETKVDFICVFRAVEGE